MKIVPFLFYIFVLIKLNTMAAIDIIKDMDDSELISYYEHCMIKRFEELALNCSIECYHPTYKYNSIYVGKDKIYKLHWNNEEFLLREMWDRYINSNFVRSCWWKSKNPWQTKISYPEKNKERIITTYTIGKEKETLLYKDLVFTLIGTGTKRKAFLSPCKTYVIKIPIEPYPELGIKENKTEYEIYSKNTNSFYAKCELIENDWLKMEYVKPEFFTKANEFPDWTLNIAEHQVGYNLEGKLVAYDYGSEI